MVIFSVAMHRSLWLAGQGFRDGQEKSGCESITTNSTFCSVDLLENPEGVGGHNPGKTNVPTAVSGQKNKDW